MKLNSYLLTPILYLVLSSIFFLHWDWAWAWSIGIFGVFSLLSTNTTVVKILKENQVRGTRESVYSWFFWVVAVTQIALLAFVLKKDYELSVLILNGISWSALTSLAGIPLFHYYMHRPGIKKYIVGIPMLQSYLIEQHKFHHMSYGTNSDTTYAPKGTSFYTLFPKNLFAKRAEAASWSTKGISLAMLDVILLYCSFWLSTSLGVFVSTVFVFVGFYDAVTDYYFHYGVPRSSKYSAWNFPHVVQQLVSFDECIHSPHHEGKKNYTNHYFRHSLRHKYTHFTLMFMMLWPPLWFSKIDPILERKGL